MPKLTIDGREVEVPRGSTILDAARKLGIDIPTLCFPDGRASSPPRRPDVPGREQDPKTPPRADPSCMVCLVRLSRSDRLVPSCGAKAEDGMRVDSRSGEVVEARRAALELLLSDHLGDCVAPCQNTCPAHLDIPLTIRLVAAGELEEAARVVRETIPFPAVLGRICPAPCEKACRRRLADAPVGICLLKRFVGDAVFAGEAAEPGSRVPSPGSPTGPRRADNVVAPTAKKVAVVGAGPTGLSAAYYLAREGHACVVFEKLARAGGGLRHGVEESRLPRSVLDAEIGLVREMGAEIRTGVELGRDIGLDDLRRDFDAVLVATGRLEKGEAARMGLPVSSRGIAVEDATRRTELGDVFAGGGAVRPVSMAVRAVADGRAAAVSIGQLLAGRQVTGPEKAFSTHIGKLREGEIELFLKGAELGPVGTATESGQPGPVGTTTESGRRGVRVAPSGGDTAGYSPEEARAEARRCLRCDCRKPADCRLRRHAREYGADPRRYAGERRTFEQEASHPEVVYEPGKCVACGRCVGIAGAAKERLGLAFVGRGFRVRVGVPLGGRLAEGLREVAVECVAACPTGALARR